MKYHKLIISKGDYRILRDLIQRVALVDPLQKESIAKLNSELERADIRSADKVPIDVVQLGSFVNVNTPYGKKDGLEIVLPEMGDYQRKRLSVISPMGSALIGYAQGDVVKWPMRTGEQSIVIEMVTNQ